MAPLSPISTSFVPHANATGRSTHVDVGGILAFFGYGILALSFVASIAVFFYGRILDANKVSKDAALASAEAAIDSATVRGFVQLRDRLNSGKTLLSGHIAVSGFFSTLGLVLPATVRFTTLHILADSAGGPTKVEGSGISKSFNALSATSAAFAADGRIKDAIFSKMSINKDGSVSFGFSATLDPALTAFLPSASAPATAASATTTTP